jgi:hypothetical protein
MGYLEARPPNERHPARRAAAPPGQHARNALLTVIRTVADGDLTRASNMLATIDPESLDNGTPAELVGCQGIWNICHLMLDAIRHRSR